MEKFLALVEESLNIDLVSIIISNPRQAGEITKIKIRPVLIKDCLYFQAESFTKRQAFHKNLTKEGIMELFEGYIRDYKQMEIVTKTQTIHGLISKKGKITVKRKKIGGCQKSLSHNRKKRYIIDEGTKVQFLIDLGVMTKEGKIVRTKYDKFRQINRFLEFIDMEHTPKNILIRAVKGGERAKKQTEEYRNCCQLLGVKPTLKKLLWEGEDIRG